MIFFFIIPMTTGAFGNYLIPLMIGARDMAFPRMNALSFWIFLASALFIYTSLFMGSAPNAGWFDYVPLASKEFNPGRNIDFYALGIIFNSISSTLTAGQFIVTILKSRAPGMSFNRMPLFCFAFLAASFGLLFALPALSADTIFLFLDRNVHTHFFDPSHGGSVLLWQHLFWIFGHPEVYILIVPAFGIATSIIPAFTQRKVVAFPLVAVAELLVVFVGFGVWAHHMYAVGMSTISMVFFAAATAMVVIPSTIQVFAWCMSFVTGTARFKTPLLFIAGFIFMFVTGGLTGIMFVAIPFDQQVTDTYFIVAHFHYIIFGAAVFPIFGGMYYWFPKVTGKLYYELPGQISFWILFVGTNLLFFPMHIVGLLGMTRRVSTYPDGLGWTAYNLAETIGGFVTLAGILLLLGNLFYSYLRAPAAGPDPWHGPTLEWTTSSPPPDYDYAVIPRVSSAYPNWDPADREFDRRNLADGVLVLERGHEQPAVTPVDATLRRGRPDAARVAVAAGPGARALAGLPHARDRALRRRGDHGDLLPARARRLALDRSRRSNDGLRRGSAHHGPRLSSSAGWWGMVILVASEATLFGAFIGTYFYLRFRTTPWPPDGIPKPALVVPLILLACLVATSFPMSLASRAAQAGRLRATRFFIAVVAPRRRPGTSPTRCTTSPTRSTASTSRATPTARSTTRCSAPTTRTSSSRRCSTSGCWPSSPAGSRPTG